MSISEWSATPANNNAAPPTGAPEGMAAASVNNTMREMMADIKAGAGFAVDTIADMTALTVAKLGNNNYITVAGYNSIGDGGGGTFFWNASSTATENLGTIFEADEGGTGRWIRIFEGFVNLLWFGAVGDGALGGGGTDNTTAIQNWVTFFKSINGTGFGPSNIFRYTSNILLDTPCSIVGEYNGVHNAGDLEGFILLKDGNFDGIEVTNSAGVTLRDFCIMGDTSNGGKGLVLTQCGRSSIMRFSSVEHGTDGIEYINGNLTTFRDVFVLNNVGRGLHINGLATPDTNASYYSNIDARGNGTFGVDLDNGWNIFGTFATQANGTGIRVNNCRRSVFTIYSENSSVNDIEFTNNTNLEGNTFYFSNYSSFLDNQVKPEQNHIIRSVEGADTRTAFDFCNAHNFHLPTAVGITGDLTISHPSDELYEAIAASVSANQVLRFSNSVATRVLELQADGGFLGASHGISTFVDGDTTPEISLETKTYETANTGATSITGFDGKVNGMVFTIIFKDGNTTLISSAGLKLAGAVNFVATNNDTITFAIRSGGQLHEVARTLLA